MRPVTLPTRRSVRWITAVEDAFAHKHLGHERFAQGLGHIFLQASVQTIYRQGSEALLLHLHGRERRCARSADAGIIEPDNGNVLRDAVSEPQKRFERLALYGANLLISRLTAVKIAHGKVVAERVGFFGDTLRKPLEKQGIPYHLAVTLIQNKLQKSACLILQCPHQTF